MEYLDGGELMGIFFPVVVYWVYSGMYMVLLGSLEKCRLHPKEEEVVKNLVTRWGVVKGVLVQQAIQIFAALAMFLVTKEDSTSGAQPPQKSLLKTILQFALAMVILDTWQYFMHRYMHMNKFLYKHVHSKHHQLIVPYAIGALYNQPLEGLLLDTVGGGLAYLLSGMTPPVGTVFFSFATVKTIDDHCGLVFPGNPIQAMFSNNSAYHSIHHQLHGQKYNFSQPFFVVWDKILGTYMPYTIEKRKGGGVEARPVKN